MKLVDNAKQAWKWHSVQLLAVIAVLPQVWQELPEEAKAWIPVEHRMWVVTALAVAGVVLRLRKQ